MSAARNASCSCRRLLASGCSYQSLESLLLKCIAYNNPPMCSRGIHACMAYSNRHVINTTTTAVIHLHVDRDMHDDQEAPARPMYLDGPQSRLSRPFCNHAVSCCCWPTCWCLLRLTTCCQIFLSSSIRTGLMRKSQAPCVTPRITVVCSPFEDITAEDDVKASSVHGLALTYSYRLSRAAVASAVG